MKGEIPGIILGISTKMHSRLTHYQQFAAFDESRRSC